MGILSNIFRKGPFPVRSGKRGRVGRHSYHNGAFSVRGRGDWRIGSYCALGKGISIITENHDISFPSLQGFFYKEHFQGPHPGDLEFPNPRKIKGPTVIGNDVWIGDNVIILSGARIGDGACIAAGSVVTGIIEPYTVAGGVPSRAIRKRFQEETIALLLELAWWDWPDDRVRRNRDFFYSDLTALTTDEIRERIQ